LKACFHQSKPPDGGADAGVTLLELLIVLALMSLLVGLVAPRFGRATDDWRLRSAAESVSQILRYARTRALYEQRYYVVEIRPTENRVRLLGPSLLAFRQAQGGPFDFARVGERSRTAQAGSELVRDYLLPGDIRCEQEGTGAAAVMHLIFPPSGAVEERIFWLRNRQGRKVQIHISFLLGGPGVEVVRQL
jgi:prepilin-type N-terminal cleavage/methylation domain-containing protein